MEAPPPAYWLASYPKSGNTWVRMLLNAHSLGAVDINSNANVTAYDCTEYLWNAVAPYPVTAMRAETAVYLRPAVLLHILYSHPRRPVIVKTHNARINAGGVDLIPSNLTGGGVYLVRDPRDVAVSFARHLGKTVDETICTMDQTHNKLLRPGTAIASWLTTWSRHVTSWADAEGTVVVRYEDLLADPAAQLRRILEAFGMAVNEERVQFAVDACQLDKLKAQEAERGFIECGAQERFFGQGKGWCTELTSKQARRIQEDHGEVMKRFGYV